MNNFLIKVLIVILTILSSKGFTGEVDRMFYWSNANGLVEAENCKLEILRNPKLGFANSTLSTLAIILEKTDGQSDLRVLSGSLVELGDFAPERGKRAVRIIGVNSILDPLERDAVRGDDGIVNIKHIKSISKKFIQMKSDYMNVTKGTYWKVYGRDKFLKLKCPEFQEKADYLIFNVYPEEGGRMIARVGVSSTETELFKNIRTINDSKIYNKFSDTAADESNSIGEIDSLPETALDEEKLALPSTTPPITPQIINEGKETSEKPSTQIGIDSIVCTDQAYINVRSEDLSQVLFKVKNGDRVKAFQGWGNNKFEGKINGKKYEFIKVEFIDNEDKNEKIGHIASVFVEGKSSCVFDPSYRYKLQPENTIFTGLDDKDCCNFPTLNKVTTSFTEGMRRFGSARGRGTRAHAAVDLYRYKGEPLFSVAPGVVIRSLYFFYQDTFAIEIMHSGGFVVRYGELSGKMVNGVSAGKQVKMGDRIGFMGVVSSGCCKPMLHFELYSGKLRGPLTQNGAEVKGVLYNRRRDLLNPTAYMLKWQNKKFLK